MGRSMAWRGAAALAAALLAAAAARAAEPIKLGCSMALTGGVAAIGKQVLAALQIWKDDVNAKGGLLGRPVELDCYDDQSNPSLVPGIYTKLIEVDKVDLVIGPYATNMTAPAIPVLMAHNMTTISILANAANSKFHYKRYFSMIPSGPEPEKSFSTGFFDIAMQHKNELKTVAIIGADAEFSQNAIAGARANLKKLPFRVIFDRNYPPQTTDYAPIMRAVQAQNPDIVYVAAYPPDTVGIIRAANEIGMTPKMFGGTFIGLIITAVKMQLGPLANGIVTNEGFVKNPKLDFPGLDAMLAKYQPIAAKEGLDPLGYAFPPYGYAAGQVLQQAVEGTKSLDQDQIAQYIHSHTFSTVAGDLSFGPDGEWTKERTFFVQYQHVKGHGLDQFRDGKVEPILWPPDYKNGDLIFPYAKAKQ
ncbi:MAG TPA: amino acid ABC transporter substrate-binding protein [Stellaceae bacterium]|nr:amino acid ABC transporter substrate-binding protein [Stellaceae bacterium]